MEILITLYVVGMVLSLSACAIADSEFEGPTLNTIGLVCFWPIPLVAYLIIGSMAALRWVCKRYFIRRSVCIVMGHDWHKLTCRRCGNTGPRHLLEQAVEKVSNDNSNSQRTR